MSSPVVEGTGGYGVIRYRVVHGCELASPVTLWPLRCTGPTHYPTHVHNWQFVLGVDVCNMSGMVRKARWLVAVFVNATFRAGERA